MRKAVLALVCATSGLAGLAAASTPAAAWHSYRWYGDYAPLYPAYYYGPPRVYVVPPAYAYYPAPNYRYCPPYVYGNAGTYYPRNVAYPPGVYYYPRGYWRGWRRW
jgi:hypothetical protein